MKRFGCICAILFLTTIEAGSVRLANNSAVKLRAVIRAGDGSYLGEVLVMPQQTMSWNDYWGGIGYYSNSQTPYIVTWYCVDGTDFAVCDDVATGATVVAMNCDGTRACRTKKQQQGAPPPPIQPEQFLQDEQQDEVGPPEGQVN